MCLHTSIHVDIWRGEGDREDMQIRKEVSKPAPQVERDLQVPISLPAFRTVSFIPSNHLHKHSFSPSGFSDIRMYLENLQEIALSPVVSGLMTLDDFP